MLGNASHGEGVKRFTDLRAWQACDAVRRAIYLLCDSDQIARDFGRRKQLEESASRPTAHIAEGIRTLQSSGLRAFLRYRALVVDGIAESPARLRRQKYITEERRLELDKLAEAALEEVTGLMEYLQSPEALRNARRARERQIASRPERQARNIERRAPNEEPRTPNKNANSNKEPRTELETEDELRSGELRRVNSR